MLRDIGSGLAFAVMTGVLYALGMYVGPLRWNLRADALELLVVVGIILSAIAFFAEFLGSGLDRRLRQDLAAADDRVLLREEASRRRALRLNVAAAATSAPVAIPNAVTIAPTAAVVVPFPARRQHLQ